MPKLLLIHGVGDFNESGVLAGVRSFLKQEAVVGSAHNILEADVTAFDWDAMVDRVIGARAVNREVLSRISEGGLSAANLGFSAGEPYAGLPQWCVHLLNALAVLIQISTLAWLPLLLASLMRFRLYKTTLICLSIAAVFALIVACVMLFSDDLRVTFRAIVRRIAFTILWPLLFAVIALGTVAFAAILPVSTLMVFFFFTNLNDRMQFSQLEYGVIVLLGFSLVSLVMGLVVMLSRPMDMVLNPIFKIVSDVLRYIGLPEYRTLLINRLGQTLELELGGTNHLIICAHSLGSVIAADALLQLSPEAVGNCKLDFITMGSPLNRAFWWGFPEIFASPEEIFDALSAKFVGMRWLNIYRPLDYIGGPLSDPAKTHIINRSTQQCGKFHLNYWGDPIVAGMVATLMSDYPRAMVPASTPIIQNWPTRFVKSYTGMLSRIWRSRTSIVGTTIWVLFAGAIVSWLAQHIFRHVHLQYVRMLMNWSGATLIVLMLFGLFAWFSLLRDFHKKVLHPFLSEFYGTLPSDNPQGIARPRDQLKFATQFNWKPWSKRFAQFAVVSAVILAVFAWLNRSWMPVGKPFGFAYMGLRPEFSPAAYFQSDDRFFVAGPGGREIYQRSNDGCYRKVSGSYDGSYDPYCINKHGLITLISPSHDPVAPKCSFKSQTSQSELPPQYCAAPEIAYSNSGRYFAAVRGNRFGQQSLLIRDVLEDRDLEPVKLSPSETHISHLAFSANDDLLVLHNARITTYTHLSEQRPATTEANVRSSGEIVAFTIDEKGRMATIDDRGSLRIYEGGHQISQSKLFKNEFDHVPALAFSPGSTTIAVVRDFNVQVYDWHRYNYTAAFLNRNRDDAPVCTQ